MRISTSMLFQLGSNTIVNLQANMAKTQEQISSNLSILTPADNPVAAAAALGVDQSLAMNSQFTVNNQNATSALSQEESTLSSVTTSLQSIQTLVVGAGSGTVNNSDLQTYATQLKSAISQLMGLANSQDATGNYMFGGYQTSSPPFTASATGASYSGDQGQRMLQVATGTQIAISDSGSSVFENNVTGNGQFVTAAASTNTGSGIISPGSVTDASQLTGDSYSIAFAIDAVTGATTYTVNDNTTNPSATPPTVAAQPYVSGQAISFNGMQLNVTGTPAAGDTFTVNPSSSQSIFTTLQNLLTTLTTPASGAAGQAALTNGLNTASSNISNALSNILAVSTSVGARLDQLTSLNTVNSDLNVQYTQTLSNLQGIDTAAMYSLFTQQGTTLQAAQQSFITISGLSLFSLMK